MMVSTNTPMLTRMAPCIAMRMITGTAMSTMLNMVTIITNTLFPPISTTGPVRPVPMCRA